MGKKRSHSMRPFVIPCVFLAFGCGSQALGEQQNTGNTFDVQGFHLELSPDDSLLKITISAPTTGWIAVGFDPGAAMKDADLVIGYISDGTVFLRDDWGDGYTSHSPDTELGGSSDATVVSGLEEQNTTTITFTIPLASTDEYDKNLEVGGTYTVLIAYGPDDADNFNSMHQWVETIEATIR